VDPKELVTYSGQIVELDFADGARERVHILSVDPDDFEHHVVYSLLEVVRPASGGAPPARVGAGLACSAQNIAGITPTDGLKHRPVRMKPWWRFW
jgi:hypothetical protein